MSDSVTAASQLNLSSPADSSKSVEPQSLLSVCKVRESGRAKHVSIKISVVGEVEVVVPVGFERTKLPALLEKRRGWIEKTRSRLINAAADTPEDWSAKKPETVSFRWQSDALEETAAAEVWQIGYLKGQRDSPTGRLRQRTQCIPLPNHRVTVKGNIENIPACQAVLRKWLAHRAQEDLSPWLRQLGFDLDLPCRRISVRGQKTRWASCSSQKDISLNYKLLFLPRPLVHYVLVHELCHTVHMNHSKDFWQLVGQKQPDYKQWDKQLKTGWRYVPRWVES